MSYLIRCVLAKPRLILDKMCRLYVKFASYVRRVLFFLVYGPIIIGCNNNHIVYYRPLTVTKWPTNGVINCRYVSRLLNINFYWPLCPTVFCFAYCVERKAQINSTVIPWTILFHRIDSQNDEKPHTAELDDTAIPHIKIKITKIPREKKAQYRNTVNPHVPLLDFHLSGVVYCITRRANVTQLYAIVTKQMYIFRGWGVGKILCTPRSTSPSLRDSPLESGEWGGGWGICEPQEFFFVIKFPVWLFFEAIA